MTLLIFAFMIGVSVFCLLWFLNRPLTHNLFHLEKVNIALARQKQTELRYDLQQGLIEQSALAEAENDIQQVLATELGQGNQAAHTSQLSIGWQGLIVTLVAAMSLTVYQSLSSQPLFSTSAHSAASAPPLEAQIAPLNLLDSATKIQTHLLENPNDANAWQMLGLTYFELNQLDAAISAYEKSYRLEPKNPRLLVEYASTLAIKNDDVFSGRPIELVKQALALDPNAPDALYMAGLFAVSQQDFVLAEGLWQRALSVLPLDSPDRGVLKEVLAELTSLVETNQLDVHSTATYSVTVNVVFSDAVLANSAIEDYVMVYVKAASGRPMPVAIKKIKRQDFSGQVILTDADSMMPNRPLSSLEKGIVVVRLSPSGAAMRQVEDQQVSSAVIDVKTNPVLTLEVQ